MIKGLLDTNIIILHLSGKESFPFSLFFPIVSTLTIFELLQYPGMSNEEENAIRAILSICEPVSLNTTISERAALLRRKHQIGITDVLIAATALELKIPLITKNKKDFKNIPDLEIYSHF